MKKPFPTLAVVGAYTGFPLEDGGFGKIHEVFDHLYPGIMTLGVAAMWDRTKVLLGEQIPKLRELPAPAFPGEVPVDVALKVYTELCLALFGPTIEVDGPYNPTPEDLEEFGKRIRDMVGDKPVLLVKVPK